MSALQGGGIRRVSRAEPLETSLMATCALPVPPRTITFNLIPLSSAQLSDFEQSSLDSKVSLINKRPLEGVYIHRGCVEMRAMHPSKKMDIVGEVGESGTIF